MASIQSDRRANSHDDRPRSLHEDLRASVAPRPSKPISLRPLEEDLAELHTPLNRAWRSAVAEMNVERAESKSKQSLVVDRGIYGMPVMVSLGGVTMMSLGAVAFHLQNTEVACKWLFFGSMLTAGGIGQFSLACLMRYFRGTPPNKERVSK